MYFKVSYAVIICIVKYHKVKEVRIDTTLIAKNSFRWLAYDN